MNKFKQIVTLSCIMGAPILASENGEILKLPVTSLESSTLEPMQTEELIGPDDVNVGGEVFVEREESTSKSGGAHIQNLFYKNSDLIMDNIVNINESIEFDGIRFTIEEVLVSDKKAIIVTSTEKLNGEPFSEVETIYGTIETEDFKHIELDAYIPRPESTDEETTSVIAHSSRDVTLSKDKTKLIHLFEYEICDGSLYGKPFEIRLIDLGKNLYSRHKVDVNLNELLAKSMEWGYLNTEINQSVDSIDDYTNFEFEVLSQLQINSLAQSILDILPSEFNIDRVQYGDSAFNERGLSIIADNYQLLEKKFENISFFLRDTTTGKEFTSNRSTSNHIGEGEMKVLNVKFNDTYNKRDMSNLENMELMVEIEEYEAISNCSVEISFLLPEEELSKKGGKINVDIDEGNVVEFNLDPLGLKLVCEEKNNQTEKDNMVSKTIMNDFLPEVQLLYKDNTTEILSSANSLSSDGIIVRDFRLSDEKGTSIIDIYSVKGIIIGGEIILFE
ncbi:hypothetical protein AN639_05005 [Candidatus Epulonipiscium fishelsonii]|nr:hypothetical protein AN639_05005 [Epulopiscium sp. SCG-B05WGA-EpuloA1]